MDPKRPVLEDFVVITDSNGAEKRRVSILEAFRDTPHQSLLRKRKGDVTHNNTLQVLDGALAEKLPAFAAGNVLLSMRANSIVAVLDMETEKIAWARTGSFKLQHDPQILPNGNLLMFDNGFEDRHQSRALELDPSDLSKIWEYPDGPHDPFFTTCCGLTQRLPNDNTLVVTAEAGRTIEVTRDGEIVWEFLTPHIVVPYVKALFEFVRLPEDFPTDWAVSD
jgi:outer membrane protein assembly factor BamB